MIRHTRMYRRLWYIKRRRSTGMRIIFILTLIIIILSLLSAYAQNKVFPYVLEMTEMKARTLITSVVSDTIIKEFGRNPGYEDIVLVEKDSSNRVTSIQTNVSRLNMLSSSISEEIQSEFSSDDRNEIGIPLGALLGNAIFSAEGPDIYVRFVSKGRVETEFVSEFIQAGINQTKHSIKLMVKVKVGIAAPIIEKQKEILVEIPLAETVIVGNVKTAYGNIQKRSVPDKLLVHFFEDKKLY